MPNAAYFKNHAGLALTDEQMQDIPNPRAELITHITIKDVQAFGLLGSLVIGPLAAVARSQTRNLAGVTRLATKCGTVGAALGLVAGPAMAIARMKSLNDDEVRDRCYRLRCNRNQVRVDQASIIGGIGGAAAGAYAGPGIALGAVLGISSGVLLAAAYNAKHKDKTT